MNPIKKLRTAYSILRTQGLDAVHEAFRRNMRSAGDPHVASNDEIDGDASVASSVADIFSSRLLFRYATCNDLLKLKARYPDWCFFDDPISNASEAWGLKQMGTLFCSAKIQELRPGKLLEIGAGCDTLFDNKISREHEYWMIDDAGFYPKDRFDDAMKNRIKTRFVQGLLGQFAEELPDNYFDLVFFSVGS